MSKKFSFDDKYHRYYLDGVEMTGCTTVLGILAKPALIGWAAKMASEYVKDNAKEYSLNENFLIVSKSVIEESKTAYAKFRDKRAGEGTNTHALIEKYIKISMQEGGTPATALSEDESLNQFSKWAQENVSKFLGSEQKFYSESLFVAGTADFTFERKDGKRFLGDIKTYKKIWDNIPFIQCGGYALMAEEMGEEPYYGYCIVNLPPKGELECMWNMDVEGDKRAFKNCVELYRFIKKL